MSFFERLFQLSKHHTSFKTEVIAGITTFLTMAYVIFVAPSMLSQVHMDAGAVFTATALTAAFACFICGIFANYPIAIAPGMALLAYFTFSVVKGAHYSWENALGAVFIAGLLFSIVAVTPMRQMIINAIPKNMVAAISAGLGLFIAILGLRNGGLITANHSTLVTLGDIHSLTTVLFFLGFCLIVALDYLRIHGAIVIGIIVVSVLGMLAGHGALQGVVSAPPSLLPTFLHLHFSTLLSHTGIAFVFSFFLVSMFDSAGTFIGILHQVHLFSNSDKTHRALSRGLLSVGLASIVAGTLGTTSASPYVESAAGVRAGGRTGLTSVVVAILFLLSLFFSPLAKSIPPYATGSAMLFVGCLMIKGFTQLSWDDMSETIPALITAIMIPLTFSIAIGMGLGFISLVLIKLFTGKIREVKPAFFLWTIIFLVYFYLIAAGNL